MQRSKSYAMLSLIGAFLAGSALGYTADRFMHRDRRIHSREEYRRHMAEELSLTPVQRKAMDSLMDERHRQIVALYKPYRPQLDSIATLARGVSNSAHEQIKKFLSPAQAVKLDELRAAALRDRPKTRGWPTRPPG